MESSSDFRNNAFFILCQSDKNEYLFEAVKSGELNLVKMMLNEGAALDANDDYKRKPLHCAAECGHAHIVNHLLLSGADVNVQSLFGQTAFEFSVLSGNKETAYRLLSAMSDEQITHYKNKPEYVDIIIQFEQQVMAYRQELASFFEIFILNQFFMPNHLEDPLAHLFKFIREYYDLVMNKKYTEDQEAQELVQNICNKFPLWYLHRLKFDSIFVCESIYNAKLERDAEAELARQQAIRRNPFQNREMAAHICAAVVPAVGAIQIEQNAVPIIFSQSVITNSIIKNKKRKGDNEIEIEQDQLKKSKKSCDQGNNFNINFDNNNDDDSDDDFDIGMNIEPNKFQFKF